MLIQVRDKSDKAQDEHREYVRRDESLNITRSQVLMFDGLDVNCYRKSIMKDDSNFFGLGKWKDRVAISKNGKLWEEIRQVCIYFTQDGHVPPYWGKKKSLEAQRVLCIFICILEILLEISVKNRAKYSGLQEGDVNNAKGSRESEWVLAEDHLSYTHTHTVLKEIYYLNRVHSQLRALLLKADLTKTRL